MEFWREKCEVSGMNQSLAQHVQTAIVGGIVVMNYNLI